MKSSEEEVIEIKKAYIESLKGIAIEVFDRDNCDCGWKISMLGNTACKNCIGLCGNETMIKKQVKKHGVVLLENTGYCADKLCAVCSGVKKNCLMDRVMKGGLVK